MKKLLFLLFIGLFLLIGCGSNESEEFAKKFNEKATNEDIAKLNADDYGEIVEEENFIWRELFESDRYTIDEYFDSKKDVSGYGINIYPSEPFENQEGEGYRASIAIASTLGLNSKDFANNFKTALRKDEHSYSDSGYDINFIYIGWDSSVDTSIIIRFEKQ